MSEEQFKAGELVRLKSGGPNMSVEQVGEQAVRCAWFVDDKLQRETFAPEALEHAPKPEGTSSFFKRA